MSTPTIPRSSLDHAAQALAYMRECQRAAANRDPIAALEAADACAEAHARAADDGPPRWRQHHLTGARVVVAWARAIAARMEARA